MKYCCYYSYIDNKGKKLNLSNLSRKDSIYKEILADSIEEAMAKFKEYYPSLRMIGIRKDREFNSISKFNSGLIGKLYN